MTFRERIASLVVAAGLIMAAPLSIWADEGHERMCRHMQRGHKEHHTVQASHYLHHLLRHAKEIELTTEQIGKVKAMQLDLGRIEARAEADIKIARLELTALLEDEQADLAAIEAKVNQLKNGEGALLVAAMLTPDQREKDRAHHERMGTEGRHGDRGREGMRCCKGMMGGGGGDHGGGGPGDQRPGKEEHRH